MKLRLRYTKLGKVRFLGHRDLARVWERALRRVGAPVAYSQGFSPRPRLSFGLALTTGAESEAEYLDVELADPSTGDGGHPAPTVDPDGLAARLRAALPVGVDVTAATVLAPAAPSLQQVITSCTWRFDLPEVEPTEAARAVAALLGADRAVVTRSRKGAEADDDVRPAVLALDASPCPDGPGSRLVAELAAQPRALRPSELLEALGLADATVRLRRCNQWIRRGDDRWEPEREQADGLPPGTSPVLPAPRTTAAHAPGVDDGPATGAAAPRPEQPGDTEAHPPGDPSARPRREERNDVRHDGPRPPGAEPDARGAPAGAPAGAERDRDEPRGERPDAAPRGDHQPGGAGDPDARQPAPAPA